MVNDAAGICVGKGSLDDRQTARPPKLGVDEGAKVPSGYGKDLQEANAGWGRPPSTVDG